MNHRSKTISNCRHFPRIFWFNCNAKNSLLIRLYCIRFFRTNANWLMSSVRDRGSDHREAFPTRRISKDRLRACNLLFSLRRNKFLRTSFSVPGHRRRHRRHRRFTFPIRCTTAKRSCAIDQERDGKPRSNTWTGLLLCLLLFFVFYTQPLPPDYSSLESQFTC